MLFAAVWDLLLSLFEPWQQLLFYVATHSSEQTQISICEKTHQLSVCVCLCRAATEKKNIEYYEMIMEVGASVTEKNCKMRLSHGLRERAEQRC